ncbi:MAG: hypothetical protein R6T98_03275 [Desulfatiglandales bacterium]
MKVFMGRCYVSLFFLVWLSVITSPLYSLTDTPQLLYPEGGETTVSPTPLFEWEPLPHAISYELEILSASKNRIRIQKIGGTEGEWQVPTQYFLQGPAIYYWRLRAIYKDDASEWTGFRSFMVQENSWAPKDDDDKDGIPNDIEKEFYRTDPHTTTLFVRPKKEVGFLRDDYWQGFINLFPDKKAGFAKIPPFDRAGIEIVVIGSPNHKYSEFDNFYYDPASDHNNLPCNIMELVYKRKANSLGRGIFCTDYSYHEGHTFFAEYGATMVNGVEKAAPAWSWDTKGYTPKGKKHHDYFIPQIYPFPLSNYVEEGAYKSIGKGSMPETTDCKDSDDIQCRHSSPMNLNANDPAPNPPYSLRPDETVEFNEICFESDGKIRNTPPMAKEYHRDSVLKRTIVHEMGHALLTADKEDHCQNPLCIMYERTIDWEMHDFGPCTDNYCCEHRPGGAKDIRKMIYNQPHFNK